MNDYQAQGENFLKKTGTKMTVKFVKYGPHFPGEKESRDIFLVTFARSGRKKSILFGQSINNSTGDGEKPPTAYDVLACIIKSDPYDFHAFCNEYGYDDDSRKAMSMFKAVEREWKKVNLLFGDVIGELQKID